MEKHQNINQRPYSQISILIIVLVILFTFFSKRHWESDSRVIAWDVISYYAYLPAIFIYNDVSLDFIDDYQGEHKFLIWTEKASNGNKVLKTSMGMSILYLPFFLLGHFFALITDFDAGGYSAPYKFFLQLSNLFYLIIGFIYLRKLLLRYFSEVVTAISILLIFFATNLHYYSTHEATMSHAYSFSLITLFVWFTLNWYKNASYKNTLILGLLTGLIVLIRPTNILILLFFIFWDVKSGKELKVRIHLFHKKYIMLFLMALSVLLVWLPQLLYWKFQTASFLYFSYGEERFFFDQPEIIKGMFSYRKGWLLYSPIMIFALAGIFFLRNRQKSFFIPVLIFTIMNLYVVFSWWSWWYGGSFGQRALIDSYAFLIFPLAAVISHFYEMKKRKIKYLILSISLIFILHGAFQTQQYYHGAIHWDSMSKAAYWDSFGHLWPSKNFKHLLITPDYEKALKGER